MTFGESALYHNSIRSLTVQAVSDEVELLALGRDSLQQILGSKVETAIYRNYQRWALQKDEVLKKLSDIIKEKVLEQFEQRSIPENEAILQKGELVDKLIICVQGSMYFEDKDGNQTKYAQGEGFGSEYLYPVLLTHKPLSGKLVMAKDGVISELKFSNLERILGMPIKDAIEKENSIKEKEEKLASTQVNKLQEKKIVDSWDIKNFLYIEKLGDGQFGNVYLVKELTTNKICALKCVSIIQIIEEKVEDHIIVIYS